MAVNEPLSDATDEPDAPGNGSQQLTAAFARLSQTYELILHATSEGVLGLDRDGQINYAVMASRPRTWTASSIPSTRPGPSVRARAWGFRSPTPSCVGTAEVSASPASMASGPRSASGFR